MAAASGGQLAAQVSLAGALGMIGSGYHPTSDWILAELTTARALVQPIGPGGMLPIGIGFITWWLESHPHLLTDTLEAAREVPLAAIWFSFGDYRPFLAQVKRASPMTKILVQVTTVEEAVQAASDGADVIVAQGNEAGGHGKSINSTTITLTPEIVARLHLSHPTLPIISAGGIANGRGLAAALALGASGVCMGTRFMACDEAAYPLTAKRAVVEGADGGRTTVRTSVFDTLRGLPWPEEYDGRVIRNSVTRRIEEGSGVEEVKNLWEKATKEGDADGLGIFAGSSLGLIKDILPAKTIIKQTMDEAKMTIQALSKVFVESS